MLSTMWVETMRELLQTLRMHPSDFHSFLISAYGRAREGRFVHCLCCVICDYINEVDDTSSGYFPRTCWFILERTQKLQVVFVFRKDGFDAVDAVQAISGCEHWKALKIVNGIKTAFVDNTPRCSSPGMRTLLASLLKSLSVCVCVIASTDIWKKLLFIDCVYAFIRIWLVFKQF